MDSLVAAATEGMRKASSADEIKEAPKPMAPPRNEDGHMSDSAVAPTRERKKGASPSTAASAIVFPRR